MTRLGSRLKVAALSCAVATGGVLLCSAQALAAEGPPTIDNASLTNVAEHSATVQVEVNPHGAETGVEIWTIGQTHPPSQTGERMSGGVQRNQCTTLATGSGDHIASLSLSNLQPGYRYWIEVRAVNNSGETKGKSPYWFNFHTNEPPPEYVPYFPYEPVVTCGDIKSAEEAGRRLFREAEEARAAKRLAEQREREQKEALEAAERKRVAEEQANPKSTGQTLPSTGQTLPQCVVPSLRGDTLNAARRALIRHHCRLGRVASPHHHHGVLIVMSQNPKRGRKLANGAAIALTLGSGHRT